MHKVATFSELTIANDENADRLTELANDVLEGDHALGFREQLTRSSSLALLDKILSNSKARLIVATLGDQFVGAGVVGPSAYASSAHYAEISKMMIRRSCQGQGIGMELIKRLEQAARTLGYTDIILDTWDQPKILAFYVKAGYKQVGVIPHFARDLEGNLHDSYVYVKCLRE